MVSVVLRVARKLALPRHSALPVWQQDGVIALFVFVVGLLVYLADIYQLVPGTDHVGLWGRLAELTVLSGLLMLRRRVPGGLLLATVVLAVDIALGPSLPVVIVYTDFLYAATLYGSRRTSRVMMAIAVAAPLCLLVGILALAQQWRPAVIAALSFLPFVLVPVWWATNVRQQREVAEAERTNAEQLAKIAELDRRAAVAGERSRMARELHDVIAGHLSAIAIQSEAALSMSGDAKTAHSVLGSVRENSVSALEEMRALIGLLRADPDDGDETTAPARLAQLSRLVESARASGMRITVHSTVDNAVLPAAVDLTAYRIAQEALTNTVKHAPGGRVLVDIRHQDGVLTVEVGNELRPHAPRTTGTGHGLLNMRERASAVGGTLSAGPSGPGWVVRAELPVAWGQA
jgi:signal transduction histidine kinase